MNNIDLPSYTPMTANNTQPSSSDTRFDLVGDLNKIPLVCLNCGKIIMLVNSTKNYDSRHRCSNCNLVYKYSLGELAITEQVINGKYSVINPDTPKDLERLAYYYMLYVDQLEKGTTENTIRLADNYIMEVNKLKSIALLPNPKAHILKSAFRTTKVWFIDYDTRNKYLILEHIKKEDALRKKIPGYDKIKTDLTLKFDNGEFDHQYLSGKKPTWVYNPCM